MDEIRYMTSKLKVLHEFQSGSSSTLHFPTNSTEQSFLTISQSLSYSKIRRILGNLNVHYIVHKGLHWILSWRSTVHATSIQSINVTCISISSFSVFNSGFPTISQNHSVLPIISTQIIYPVYFTLLHVVTLIILWHIDPKLGKSGINTFPKLALNNRRTSIARKRTNKHAFLITPETCFPWIRPEAMQRESVCSIDCYRVEN
jgi:hypothetical protein